jgi:VWFA-related protein
MFLERLVFGAGNAGTARAWAGRASGGLSPMLNRGVMSRDRLAEKVVGVLLAAAVAASAAVGTALTAADVVRFLEAGLSERTILTELCDRGYGEPIDAAQEARLRAAGASETLVVALRRAMPAGAAAVTVPPAADAPRARTDEAGVPPAGGPTGLTFSATARSVRVPVSVLDKRGEPVLGLTGEDFKLSEDGREQPVTFFSGERRPLRIALALDISGSMRDKITEVSDALRHFIDLLEPADEIMVITFSSSVHVEQDFTSDRERLERVFSRLQPAQDTALFDAAREAIQRVAAGPAEGKAVVLVTDGVDTASQATFEEVRELARRSEVPVFSIGIDSDTGFRSVFRPLGGPGTRPRGPGRGGWPGGGGRGGWPGGGGRGWPGGGGRGGWPGGTGGTGGGRGLPAPIQTEPEFDARPLTDLADDTGGRAEILKGLDHARGPADRLKDAVESIAVTLRHRYLVGYEPDPGKQGWRKIHVEVDRPSVKVQARKGYYTEG